LTAVTRKKQLIRLHKKKSKNNKIIVGHKESDIMEKVLLARKICQQITVWDSEVLKNSNNFFAKNG